MSRNNWILLGGGVVAFLAFVLWGGGDDHSSSTRAISGIIGLFRGGGVSSSGDLAGKGTAAPGAMTPAESGEAQRSAAAAAAASKRMKMKKHRGRPGGSPDPELLRRVQAGGEGLEASGVVQAPRAGIVRQSFRARTQGSDGNIVTGGSPAGVPPPEPDTSSNPNDCGAPSVQKMVVDLAQRPDMRSSFDVPAQSFMIKNGMGELFHIGDAPAFVILSPQKNASAGAIFDDRFLVLIKGKCIPDREYVKRLLRQ